MPFPSHYFYLKEKSAKKYHAKPPGNLSVTRLAQGRDAWQDLSDVKVDTPKTIVLTDWTAQLWDEEQLGAYKSKLLTLLQHDPPFTLYVFQEGEPIELTESSLDKLDDIQFRKRINPTPPKEVQKIMARKDISKTGLLVLDNHELKELVEEQSLPKTLNVDDVLRAKIPLMEIVPCYQQEAIILILGSFTTKHLETQKKLLSCLNATPSDACTRHAIKEGYQLEIRDKVLSEEMLSTVQNAEFILAGEMHVPGETLKQCIMPIQSLKKLSIRYVSKEFSSNLEVIKTFASLETVPFSLKDLRSIDFSLSDISINALDTFLVDTRISHLNLSGIEALCAESETLKITPRNYLHLITLNLSSSDITLATLHQMLSQNESLEKLDLSNCFDLVASGSHDTFNLPMLRSLNLNDNLIDCDVLINLLLKNSMHLKKLQIPAIILYYLDEGMMQQLAPHLNKLEYLELSGDPEFDDYHEKLILLLGHCPNLNTIHLNQRTKDIPLQEVLEVCPSIKQVNKISRDVVNMLVSSPVSTPLESIYLTDVEFHESDLENLLSDAKSLKHLYLEHFSANTFCPLNPINFSSLQSCYLTGSMPPAGIHMLLQDANRLESLSLLLPVPLTSIFSHINISRLKHLESMFNVPAIESLDFLLGAPQLQTLHLCDIKEAEDTALLSASPQLTELKKIELSSRYHVSLKSLDKLLSYSHKLNSITLFDYKVKDSGHHFNSHFPNLQNITLSHTPFHEKSLSTLLSNSPNICSLNIAWCTLSPPPLTHVIPTLDSLTELTLSYTVISTELLKTILRQSPNLKTVSIRGKDISYFDNECRALLSARGITPKIQSYSQEATVEKKHLGTDGSTSSPTVNAPSSAQCDAETMLEPSTKHNVQRFFFTPDGSPSPPVNYDRLTLYDELEVNPRPCSSENAFTLNTTAIHEEDLLPSHVKTTETLLADAKKRRVLSSGPPCFIGRKSLSLTDNWQALPSLSPNETMLSFQASTDDIEITYSKKTQLYYVKGKQPFQDVDFQWLLETPKNPAIKLPADVESLIKYCQDFTPGQLKLSPLSKPTGRDYLNAMCKQKHGACRHRAIVFKDLMQQKHPDIPVRLVGNDCHMFVEIQQEGIWQTCCLGGYPAKLEIDESNQPNPSIKGPKRATAALGKTGEPIDLSPYQKHFEPWRKTKEEYSTSHDLIEALLTTNKAKTLLDMPVNSIGAIQAMLIREAQRLGRPIYIINHPDDLVCSAPFITQKDSGQGEVKDDEQGGPLHDFLITHTDPPPLIVVNYATFSDEETVRANPLLDTPPTADGTSLPPGTQVIGLTDTAQTAMMALIFSQDLIKN